MPAGTIDLEFELRTTGRGGPQYLSTDTVVVVGAATTSVAVTSIPPRGDVWLRGEVIELTLTFDRPVAVDIADGTPSIFLDVGGVQRRAHYIRGGGTRQLVFAYTVQATDSDPPTASASAAPASCPAARAGSARTAAPWSTAPGSGRCCATRPGSISRSPRVDGIGICDRNPAVRDALVVAPRRRRLFQGHD